MTTTRLVGEIDKGSDIMLQLLAVKESSGETAVTVTDLAMRACGGAAFSKHLGLERAFRDARAAIVKSDSGVQCAEDLRGKTIAFGAKDSPARQGWAPLKFLIRIFQDSTASCQDAFRMRVDIHSPVAEEAAERLPGLSGKIDGKAAGG